MNILLVEDNANLALVLEYALSEAGHDVLGPVGISVEAYALAVQHQPDFALVDIDLADGKTGYSLSRRLEEDLLIPSVYVTGSDDIGKQEKGGAIGFIKKPCNLSNVVEIVDVIENFLNGRSVSKIPMELKLFDSRVFG